MPRGGLLTMRGRGGRKFVMADDRLERLRGVAKKSLRAQQIRAPLSELDAMGLARGEVKSGEGKGGKVDPKELKKLHDKIRFRRGVEKFRRPDWAGKLSKDKAQPKEVVDAIMKQVASTPVKRRFVLRSSC